jgi:hypothetical protein
MATELKVEAEDGGAPQLAKAGCDPLALQRGRPIDRSLSDPKVEEAAGNLRPRKFTELGADHRVG